MIQSPRSLKLLGSFRMPAADSAVPPRAKPYEVLGLGLAFAAIGLFFILAATGLVSVTGPETPEFVVFCVGLAFLIAGLTCYLRMDAGLPVSQDDASNIAAPMPGLNWRALAIGAIVAAVAIVTWVVFGSGPRTFSVPASFAGNSMAGELIGRSLFALAATVGWISVAVLTFAAVRKILANRDG